MEQTIEYKPLFQADGDKFTIAAAMLLAGVAFQEDRIKWNVFSHEGDQLGTLSTFMVSAASRLLKQAGYVNDGLADAGGHPTPYHKEGFPLGCLSYGRKVKWPPGVLEELMTKLWEQPHDFV